MYISSKISIFSRTLFSLLLILLVTGSSDALHAQSKSSKSSSKKKQSAGAFGKSMQDLSSRFNRYFNAKLQYMEAINSLENNGAENYDELLPVYTFQSGDGTGVSGNTDAIIKKTSLAIQMKPNSKWVDDCFVLLGKAYYLKGDTDEAKTSFEYVNKRFSKSIRNSYDRKSKDKIRQLQEKDRERAKKEREAEAERLKKEREKEREASLKEREAAKKEREKDKKAKEKARAKDKKAREKSKKKKEKERAKYKKAYDKVKAQRAKIKKKNKDRRKQGKSQLPLPEYPEKPWEKEDDGAKEDTKTEVEKLEEKKATEKAEEEAAKAAEEELAAEEAKKDDANADENTVDGTVLSTEGTVTLIEGHEKSYKGGIGHKLAMHEAKIWLARTYIDQELYNEADLVIKEMQKDKSFPKKWKGELNRLIAYYLIERGNKSEANTALKTAIKGTKKSEGKARLNYIAAQLHQQSNDHDEALKSFKKVLKSRPDFDMALNARLNIARTKLQNGSFSPSGALAYLEKMAKEDKYVDHTDQIYFVMSDIAMQSGDVEKATEYLSLSASTSTSNPEQKALAFLKLANMSYTQERYVPAAAYYDSTFVSLPQEHEEYDQVKARKENLGELVMHLNTVELQDSLLRIANMSDKARNVFIEELIERLEEEALKAQEEAEQEFLTDKESKSGDSASSGSVWYFYNPSAKGKGYNEFKTQWGSRPDVDNWRLSSKIASSGEEDGVLAGASDAEEQRNALMQRAAEGVLSRDDILAQLPLTEEKKTAAHDAIKNALFQVGRIYGNKLESYDKSSEAFNDLLTRYPTYDRAAETLYNLYVLAEKQDNAGASKTYKNRVVNEYPKSKYAKLLADANYAEELSKEGRELEQYYEQTFSLFKMKDYETSLKRIDEVNSKFEENPLQPKFDLLRAFVVGATEDKDAYVAALEGVVAKYPEDDVRKKAEETLLYLVDLSKLPVGESKSSLYTYAPEKQHYVIITFGSYTQKVSQIRNNVSDFNSENFSVNKLKTTPMMLNKDDQIILVKSFANADKAMQYYTTLQSKEANVFSGIDTSYQFFVISKKNFTPFYKDKNIDAYMAFFLKEYMGK